jgi:hypothetical protein
MSEQEHIFLRSGLSPDETAHKLAEVLHASILRHGNGEIGIHRPAAADPVRSIGGEVFENEYGDDNPEAGDEAVYDRYDLVFELWLSGSTDEGLLHAESRRLYSAWSPSQGRTDFPPDTSPYAETRTLWERYARP